MATPEVLWDPHAQRVLILATDYNSRLFLGVSESSDAAGAYWTTYWATNEESDAGRRPDYPTFGVDAHGIYSGYLSSATILERPNAVCRGEGAPARCASSAGHRHGFPRPASRGSQPPLPELWKQPSPVLCSPGSSTHLSLRRILPPITAPILEDLPPVVIPAHSLPPDVDSMGSSVPLETIDHRLMNAVYRDGHLWTVHTVEAQGRAALRWYQVDPLHSVLEQVGTLTHRTWDS